jgi:hypothetical protein
MLLWRPDTTQKNGAYSEKPKEYEIKKMKKMKKILPIIGVVLIICLGLGFCYLLYKTWSIFGFWTLAWTLGLEVLSTALLGQMIGSKTVKSGLIIYNPKEWPKFLNMLVSLAVGYYLYTIITNPGISSYDYTFGLSYLILLTALPICYAIFKLFRDRNDFISIDNDTLQYRDNNEKGEIKFTDIAKVEISQGIKLTFKNDKVLTIKTDNMNFNMRDLMNAYNDIKAKLPEEKTEVKSNELDKTKQ